MHQSTSTPYPAPVPPTTPTAEESERREAFQALHPEVGFSPLALCENPEEAWVAYWWDAEKGESRHVPGPNLGDVLDSLAEEFG